METLAQAIPRHRTAMKRYSLSKPVTLALAHQVVSPGLSVFDYGCGQGTDIRLLEKAGIHAVGWDPHFSQNPKLSQQIA